MKAKVYLWTEDVQIVKMGTDEAISARLELSNVQGSLTNICTVMQAAMPSNDVEAMIHLIVETVHYSQKMGESDPAMENRIYHAIMAESIFNK